MKDHVYQSDFPVQWWWVCSEVIVVALFLLALLVQPGPRSNRVSLWEFVILPTILGVALLRSVDRFFYKINYRFLLNNTQLKVEYGGVHKHSLQVPLQLISYVYVEYTERGRRSYRIFPSVVVEFVPKHTMMKAESISTEKLRTDRNRVELKGFSSEQAKQIKQAIVDRIERYHKNNTVYNYRLDELLSED